MNHNAPLMLAMAATGGGALGALLRHLTNVALAHRVGAGLILSTWLVNVVGCFLAGLVLVWIDSRGETASLWRALLVTGVLGGLTTFSALGVELWQLLRTDRYTAALMATAAHVVLGVAAVALGWRLGRLLGTG